VAVEPDILILAKGIASGLPLSGIVARRELIEAWPPGTHGGTYGGNIVSCAAALATIDVLESEGLIDNARNRGEQLLAGVRELQGRYPVIGDTRGLGLMVAMEMIEPGVGDGRRPNPAAVKTVLGGALERGLMVLSAGPYGNVVRVIPPLVTTADEIDQALGILDEALAAI
jgi:4-aminobutyrate aminotransferase